METTEIKNIGFTVADIELISKALDHYTNKDIAGRVLGGLMGAMLTDGNPMAKAAWEKKEAELARKQERELDMLKDDIRLLQSKVIMLKRLLIESNLMESIKNYPPPSQKF